MRRLRRSIRKNENRCDEVLRARRALEDRLASAERMVLERVDQVSMTASDGTSYLMPVNPQAHVATAKRDIQNADVELRWLYTEWQNLRNLQQVAQDPGAREKYVKSIARRAREDWSEWLEETENKYRVITVMAKHWRDAGLPNVLAMLHLLRRELFDR
jgi:hypothetical protein